MKNDVSYLRWMKEHQIDVTKILCDAIEDMNKYDINDLAIYFQLVELRCKALVQLLNSSYYREEYANFIGNDINYKEKIIELYDKIRILNPPKVPR